MKESFILLIIGILILSIFSVFQPIKICTATEVTIYVDDDGGQDYTKIQDAINAANEGDTIYIYNGSYNENIIVNIELVLVGEDKDSTIITGSSNNQVTLSVKGTALEYVSNVSISGLKILQNPTAVSNEYANIYIEYATKCTIKDSIISDGFNGIRVKQTDESTISGNTIKNNDGDGILLFISSDKNEIKNNVIKNNKRGIYIQDFCTENTIVTNDISESSNYGILIMGGSNSNIIYHNNFENGNKNANDECSNIWDDGSEGNYWDDYTGSDSDGDGIGDMPYNVPGSSNQDRYPLGDFIGSNQQPTATIQSISPNPAAEGQLISFNGNGTDLDGSIAAWQWKVDEVVVASSEDFSSSSFSEGAYSIKYRVQDNEGFWSSFKYDTFVVASEEELNNAPIAYFLSPEDLITRIYGESILFYGSGEDPDQDDTLNYSWSSDKDGSLSSESEFYKSDLSIGTHAITFRVTDNHEAYSEETRTIIITIDPNAENNLPIADAGGPYTGVTTSSVIFDGSASYDPDEGDSIIDYSWDFGDGVKDGGAIVEHTYSIPGTYTVQLTVTDNYGEQHMSETTVKITSEISGQSSLDYNKLDVLVFGVFFILVIGIILLFIKKKRR